MVAAARTVCCIGHDWDHCAASSHSLAKSGIYAEQPPGYCELAAQAVRAAAPVGSCLDRAVSMRDHALLQERRPSAKGLLSRLEEF